MSRADRERAKNDYEDFCKELWNGEYRNRIRNRKTLCKFNRDADTKGLWIEYQAKDNRYPDMDWKYSSWLTKNEVIIGNYNITYVIDTDDLKEWLVKQELITPSLTTKGARMTLDQAEKIYMLKYQKT